MPIRPFLSGQAFDPETIQVMSDAFTSICADLGLVEDRVISASMERDRTVAGTPEREAAQRECDAALAAFKKIANQVR
jgi:hypothetical protein